MHLGIPVQSERDALFRPADVSVSQSHTAAQLCVFLCLCLGKHRKRTVCSYCIAPLRPPVHFPLLFLQADRRCGVGKATLLPWGAQGVTGAQSNYQVLSLVHSPSLSGHRGQLHDIHWVKLNISHYIALKFLLLQCYHKLYPDTRPSYLL